jgi:hypothetical protein
MGKSSGSSGVGIGIFFILLSIFSGLILSIWALKAKKTGDSYLLQLIFGLIFIVFFGYISYNFYTEYIPGDDKLSYYIGMTGTYTNGLAALIWLIALFSKSE